MYPVAITIPQLGEGLVEAKIVSFQKRAGETVKRDEPLVELETDKAVIVVESPVDGVVEAWLVEEGSVMPVGAEIGCVRGQSPTAGRGTAHTNGVAKAAAPAPEAADGAVPVLPAPHERNAAFSPRVRAYCQSRGIDAEQMATVARRSPLSPLTISDVDQWLEKNSKPRDESFRDLTISARQKLTAQRLTRAWQQAVPASMEVDCSWDAIQEARGYITAKLGEANRPSSLSLIAWCVVRSMENHPKFRSAMVGDNTLREYKNVTLGIAVGLPDDEFTTATVANADLLEFGPFVEALKENITLARSGHDANRSIQLTISKLTNENIHYAVPVIVPPAVCTLFVGAPYDIARRLADDSIRWEKVAQFVLTFDHRVAHGMGGARFLQEIQSRIANLPIEFA